MLSYLQERVIRKQAEGDMEINVLGRAEISSHGIEANRLLLSGLKSVCN